jgi:hypothetical protein
MVPAMKRAPKTQNPVSTTHRGRCAVGQK